MHSRDNTIIATLNVRTLSQLGKLNYLTKWKITTGTSLGCVRPGGKTASTFGMEINAEKPQIMTNNCSVQ